MRFIPILLAIALAIPLSGCDETTKILSPEDLAPPLGLTSITGDGKITLSWQASNHGEDREEFHVYQADGDRSGPAPNEIPTGTFGSTPVEMLATTTAAGTFTVEVDNLINGETYSFLVVAAKDDGQKLSRPSNIISDTPRDEWPVVSLVNGAGNARYLDVGGSPPTPSSSSTGADILAESFDAGAGPRHGMVAANNNARIQDLGYVASWDEVDEAPLGLASYPAADFSVQVLDGHVYAIFTGTSDNHYAKVYIENLHNPSSDYGYDLRVAYQPDPGNNELAPKMPQ